MRTKETLLTEIYTLIDQQLQVLGGDLNAHNTAEYVQRRNRIKELLDEIAQGRSDTP
jgi:hypothetical protein